MEQQLRALWQHKVIIASVALVAGVVAFAISAAGQTVYHASTKVMVGNAEQTLTAIPSDIGGLQMTYLQSVGSQIEVIRSRPILEQALSKIEPDITADNETLQLEILQLGNALSVEQVGSTKVVEISVASTDPNLAQKQANAIAEAYVNTVNQMTQTTIERALEETTERLMQLQNSSIDLSTNPVMPQFKAQVNTAFTALNFVSQQLRLIEKTGADTVAQNSDLITGTVITASQLDMIKKVVEDIKAEATEIDTLSNGLNNVNNEEELSERSATIAIIENHVRVVQSKINSLIINLTDKEQAETDSGIRDQLRSLQEQLKITASASAALLDQVVRLYSVQEQYIVAGINAETGAVSRMTQIETDSNILYRIRQNSGTLIDYLGLIPDQVNQIVPRVTSLYWRFPGLAADADSLAGLLQDIIQKLEPTTEVDSVLFNRSDFSAMEITAQSISIRLASFASEIENISTTGFNLSTISELRTVKEQVNIARNAVSTLQTILSGLESSWSTASYTALDTLRQELQMALSLNDTNDTMIVDTATIISVSSSFTNYRNTILAVIVGLLLSSVAILIMQYTDRKVRDPLQVKSQFGLPLLGKITTNYGEGPRVSSILDDGASAYLEAFRSLRTNLNLDSALGKVMLVSSPQFQEGKTAVAVNLARVVALQGRNVLIIDGNLHNPGVAEAFGLEAGAGLSEFLSRTLEIPPTFLKADNVNILPAGEPSIRSAELLSSPRFKTFLENARKDYEFIILDSAGVTEITDTRIMARNVDGVLMVLQSDVSKIDMTRESLQALEAVGARIEGFVLNSEKPSKRKPLNLASPSPQDEAASNSHEN